MNLTPKKKPIPSKVKLFSRPTVAATEGIASKHGAMLPGPAYDHYKAMTTLLDALQSLHSDMVNMALTKAEALERLEAVPMPATTYSSIEQAVAGLRSTLTNGTGEAPRYLDMLKAGISQLSTAVVFAADEVPRPVSPNAVQPVEGQRLGTGLYNAWMNS